MKHRVKRAILIPGIVGLAVILGAMLGRAQSSFPIRFDDPSAGTAPLVDGGFVIWTGQILDGTKQTILPIGTLDTTAADHHGVNFRILVDPSTGPCIFTSGANQYGVTASSIVGDLTLQLESDGSYTIQRTAGTNTHSVVLRGLYI